MLQFLHVIDILWSLFIVFPLTALFWSGSWKLLDTYIYPNNPDKNALICIFIGSTVGVFGFIIFPLIKSNVRIECSFKHVFVSRTLIYVYANSNLMFWRGMWNLSLQYFVNSLLSSALFTIASILFLMLFKCCGQTVGNPFCVSLDTYSDIYDSSTRYKCKV